MEGGIAWILVFIGLEIFLVIYHFTLLKGIRDYSKIFSEDIKRELELVKFIAKKIDKL